jgi:hypothetical protein
MGRRGRHSNGDVLQALRLAAPFAILARFEGLAHCVEASVAGANALREYGFKVKTAPCAVRLVNREAASSLTIGYSRRQIYERLTATPDNPLPPFEEWQETHAAGVPDEEAPMHQIIWAKANGETYLIDLTIAQLRETGVAGCESLPSAIVVECGSEVWPSLDKFPWNLTYEASPHSPEVLGRHAARVAQYPSKNLTDDMRTLLGLAFQAGLDFDRFTAGMRVSNPTAYAEASERMQRVLRIATRTWA